LDNVLAAIESGIDMIDYAASRDQLHVRLSSLLARAATLYGPLIRLNPFPLMHTNVIGGNGVVTTPRGSTTPSSTTARNGISTASISSSVSMDVANILPLAAVTARIPPLPATLYPTKVTSIGPLSTATSSVGMDDLPSGPSSLSSFDSGTSSSASIITIPTTNPAATRSTVTTSSGWSSLLPAALPVRGRTPVTGTSADPAGKSTTPSVASFLGKLGLRV
jgi:hypothetical protein